MTGMALTPKELRSLANNGPEVLAAAEKLLNALPALLDAADREATMRAALEKISLLAPDELPKRKNEVDEGWALECGFYRQALIARAALNTVGDE